MSLYSIEFKKKLMHAYFVQKVRIATEKIHREKEMEIEYYQKHFCKNGYSGHDFVRYSPHPGCVKAVCRLCLEEGKYMFLKPSVHSRKGKSFGGRITKPSKTTAAPRKPRTKKTKPEEPPQRTASQIEWED